MKKILVSVFCIVLILSLTGCSYHERKKQAIASMFDSFDKSEDFVLLTCFELVVDGTHYDLEDIKYSDQRCNIVFLQEDGFYSYIYHEDTLHVEFLYTLYDTFETISLGTDILPSKIIHSFWGDNSFWFRMDNPDTDEHQQMYYSWCINTNQVNLVDSDSISRDYEYSIDCNRSTKYSFAYTSKLFGDYLKITDNESGITKKVNRSVLNTFEEGKKIKKSNSSTRFNISQAFEDNGTIYFVSILGVDLAGDPCYCYVYRWNFETEECEFYTSIRFESYQEWVADMYIK